MPVFGVVWTPKEIAGVNQQENHFDPVIQAGDDPGSMSILKEIPKKILHQQHSQHEGQHGCRWITSMLSMQQRGARVKLAATTSAWHPFGRNGAKDVEK